MKYDVREFVLENAMLSHDENKEFSKLLKRMPLLHAKVANKQSSE